MIHLPNHVEDVPTVFSAENPTSVRVDSDPGSENLVGVAFDKSWRFVEKDPFLALILKHSCAIACGAIWKSQCETASGIC